MVYFDSFQEGEFTQLVFERILIICIILDFAWHLGYKRRLQGGAADHCISERSILTKAYRKG